MQKLSPQPPDGPSLRLQAAELEIEAAAENMIGMPTRIHPNPDAVPTYHAIYDQLYQPLYRQLKSLFSRQQSLSH